MRTSLRIILVLVFHQIAQAAPAADLGPKRASAWKMRYLVYTTLAYGAQGISYYVYCHPGHTGGIALSDGNTR